MRMCGHAHHDDMLYLGRDPQPTWDYAALSDQGYADAALYAYWSAHDPIVCYAARLEGEHLVTADDLTRWKHEAEAIVDAEARVVAGLPWPTPSHAGIGV